MDLYAAILRVNENQFSGVDKNSFNNFSQAIQSANAGISHLAAGKANFLKLVVAPEYYFSDMPSDFMSSAQPNPVSQSNKSDLYGKLKTLSGQYNDLIIVAGSIHYHKGGGLFSSKKTISVCPVLKNGRIIHKYHKRDDDGNTKNWDNKASFSHKDTNPVFTESNVTFGVEICAEHTGGNSLQNWVQTQNHPRLDVHILISGTTANTKSNMAAAKDKYLIHCDIQGNQAGRNGVFQVTGVETMIGKTFSKDNTTLAPAHTSGSLTGGLQVDVYHLTV